MKPRIRQCDFPLPLRLEFLERRCLLAVGLVSDINQQSWLPYSSRAMLGEDMYYAASDWEHGLELWRSDGSASGTHVVADIAPGSASSSPQELTELNGELYFVASDGVHGYELWRSDGTVTGTRLVVDLEPGSKSSDILDLRNVAGTLFISAYGSIWTSDGTSAGTREFVPNDNLSRIDTPVEKDGMLYFSARDDAGGKELWRWDGTPGGAMRVADIRPGSSGAYPQELTVGGNLLYFTANDGVSGFELWRTDGTQEGTIRLRDVWLGPSDSSARQLTPVGDTLFFLARGDLSSPFKLWKSDGTTQNTVQVSDVNIGFGQSEVGPLVNVNGLLYFGAWLTSTGRELWKSDGTAGGTEMVADLRPGSQNSYPRHLTNVDGVLFFSANDGLHGGELWRAGGSISGAERISDIAPDEGDANPVMLTRAPDGLRFVANNAEHYSLWRADADSLAPTRVHSLQQASFHADPRDLVNLNGLLLFSADDGVHGVELWKSDSSGTRLVKDIVEGPADSAPSGLTRVGDFVFFGALDRNLQVKMWKTDGTADGTQEVTGAPRGGGGGCEVNGDYYFVSETSATGIELWKTDGTAAGTTLVADISPGEASSMPTSLTNVGGILFFAASRPGDGIQLWRSDGSASGTFVVTNPELHSFASPEKLLNVGGTLYFSAWGTHSDRSLWISDGTPQGTVAFPLAEFPTYLTNVGGTVYFGSGDGYAHQELWKSDGTVAGTTLVADILPGANGANPKQLTNVGGTLYFVANDGARGYELWKSDGTSAGTQLVADVFTGLESSNPVRLTEAGGTLYFAANDGTSGHEPWQSDPANGHTQRIADLTPGYRQTYFGQFMNVGGTLYFVADEIAFRSELWRVVELTPPKATDVIISTSGAPHGFFSVPTGSGEQLRTVPLALVNRVQVAFDKTVSIDEDDLRLEGLSHGSVPFFSFDYDWETNVATWHLDIFLPADRWSITLNADGASPVLDLTGSALDGEWDNPSVLFDTSGSVISGDGVAGGDFHFDFTVLPGDGNRDNRVTGADFTIWSDRFDNRQGAADKLFTDGDWDGDGHVAGGDFTLWADHFGLDLRGAQNAPAPSQTHRIVDSDLWNEPPNAFEVLGGPSAQRAPAASAARGIAGDAPYIVLAASSVTSRRLHPRVPRLRGADAELFPIEDKQIESPDRPTNS